MYQQLTDTGIQQACVLTSLLLLLSFGVDGTNLVRTLPGFPGELPFKLETGYVGVGNSENVQLFYYFVESQRNPMNDPLVLWLNGGPGCSVLSGMVYGVGPFGFDYEAYNGSLPPLIPNPGDFSQVANMVFLDAPAGTGFSYSKTDRDYQVKDDIDAAEQNYEFLQKWLLHHPKFLNNSVYLGGSSYSGKIVPILAHRIFTGQKTKQVLKINLQGYALGNPSTDKVIDNSMQIPFSNRIGLISDELYESYNVNCGNEYLYPDIRSALCLRDLQAIKKCTELLMEEHVLEPTCNFKSDLKDLVVRRTMMDAYISNDDVVQALHGKKPWCRYYNLRLSEIWASDLGVQKALYVRKGTKDTWKRCNATTKEAYPTEIVASVVEYHRSLFESGYRALIFSGDHDFLIPYISTIKWIASLNLTLSDPWRPWIVQNQVAGYTRTFNYKDTYELTFATVKGAGHVAHMYKPKICFEMFDRWVSNTKL